MTITATAPVVAALTPDEVHNVKFTPVRYRREGYDQTEVDDFLDRVENQLRSNAEYADGLLQLLQDHGIMAPSKPEPLEPITLTVQEPATAADSAPAPALTVVPAPISDPANITFGKVA